MDGTAAINDNLQALKRILAMLLSMAGLGAGRQLPFFRRKSSGGPEAAQAEKRTPSPAPTLPRRLRLVILALLRPAESAARRLIIAAARGLAATPPPPRKPAPKRKTMEPLLRRLGIAVVISPADRARAAAAERNATRARPPGLPLFDPPKRLFRARRPGPARAVPRILFPGPGAPVPRTAPPSPDDPIDATRLLQRLAALAEALDDLPGQAKRFARWRARRDAAQGRPAPFRRIAPLRPGRPPGGRLSRYDPTAVHPRRIREVDEILAHAHALALFALRLPDTS